MSIETNYGIKYINLNTTIKSHKPKLALSYTKIYDFKNNFLDGDNEKWFIDEEQLISEDIIENSQTSYKFNEYIYKDGKITFDYSIYSEEFADYFEFYIDGTRYISDSGQKHHKTFSKILNQDKEYSFMFHYYKDIFTTLYKDEVMINSIQIENAKVEEIDFFDVNKKSDTKILTISNLGLEDLNIENISVDNSDLKLNLFAGNNPCKKSTFSLKKSNSCTFGIFTVTSNSFDSTLTINSNDKSLSIPIKVKSIKTYNYKKPTNLQANYIGPSFVSLSWLDNSSFELGYKIYRNNTLIYQTKANITEFLDENIQPKKEYTYKIVALFDGFESEPTTLTIKTPNDSPKYPSKVLSKQITNNSVLIRWQDNSEDETKYEVYRDDELIATLPINSTYFEDTNLESNTEYTYKIKVYNDYSSTFGVRVTIKTLESIEEDYIKNIQVNSKAREISINWKENSTNFSAILVYKNDEFFKIIRDKTGFIDKDVVPETKYSYKLIATDGVIDSKPIQINTRTEYEHKPSPPTDLKAIDIQSNQITIGWNDNSNNETSFYIYRDGELIYKTAENITQFTDTSLKSNKTYFYQVIAVNRSKSSRSTYKYITTSKN